MGNKTSETPLLSIIVPVYNVEQFLQKCIDSILAQTMTDFELILINDGSPDRCGEICDEYAVKDSRIIVIHQQNQGVSAARNAGLKIAKGEYIGFVDPDDWIEKNMYEAMIESAQKYCADVVACGIKYYDSDYTFIKSDLSVVKEYDNEQMLLELFGMPTCFGGNCVNKIFLRESIRNLYFPVGINIDEDWIALLDYLSYCNKMIQIPNLLYNIFERTGSATRIGVEAQYNIIINWQLVFSHTKSLSKRIRCAAMDKLLDNCLRYGDIIKQVGEKNHEKYKLLLFRVKFFMLKNITLSLFQRLLSTSKIHRYCIEMVKL